MFQEQEGQLTRVDSISLKEQRSYKLYSKDAWIVSGEGLETYKKKQKIYGAWT